MEEQEKICEELLALASSNIADIEVMIPEDPVSCFAFFVEASRVYDSWALSAEFLSWEESCSQQYLDLLGQGYNLLTFYFFKKVPMHGFPIAESTDKSRKFAITILYRLGCVSMIRRTVDMIRTGLMKVEKTDNTYVFKKTAVMDFQFLDTMEFSYLSDMEKDVKKNLHQQLDGWNIMNQDELLEDVFRPGNFFSHQKSEFKALLLDDIDKRMEPLVSPWHSGHGIMMAYGSTEEIDFHFLAIATEIVRSWREDAGFSPETKIKKISGVEITAVIVLLVSFYLKHAGFIKIAKDKFPEINIPMSLTIWSPVEEMIQDISAFTKFNISLVREIFDIIMFSPADVGFLKSHTTKFVSLLLDMGNGYVLRPLSSILYNPFYSLIPLLESRDQNIRHHISQPRESWLRSHLYALFSGWRYQVVDGNIKLKEETKTVTDLDAVIYDKLSGDLAIFQIKWQDFFFNDVKKLRSKAKNLTEELDEWAVKTTQWIDIHGREELLRNLRIKLTAGQQINGIYLFGLSRTRARMQGFGYSIKSENLAIANWPQFSRIRFRTGPVQCVFDTLHKVLKKQEFSKVRATPLPVTWDVGSHNLKYEDLYNAWDETEDTRS